MPLSFALELRLMFERKLLVKTIDKNFDLNFLNKTKKK